MGLTSEEATTLGFIGFFGAVAFTIVTCVTVVTLWGSPTDPRLKAMNNCYGDNHYDLECLHTVQLIYGVDAK
jgi:hypothetical protein